MNNEHTTSKYTSTLNTECNSDREFLLIARIYKTETMLTLLLFTWKVANVYTHARILPEFKLELSVSELTCLVFIQYQSLLISMYVARVFRWSYFDFFDEIYWG